MIKIDDEYVLNAYEHGYILQKKSTIQDTESQNYGKTIYTNPKYYTTLESALNGYVQAKTRKYISKEAEQSLEELIQEVKGLQQHIEKISKGV